MLDFEQIKSLRFNVSEIFHSIQGEGTRSGKRCVFIRMQGCRLRCSWCDTPYSLELKQTENIMTAEEIIAKVKSFDCPFIEFTGGEPMEQDNIVPLMSYLCDDGFTVAVETAGYIDVRNLDKRIIKIMDIKCPGSKMEKKNFYENLEHLSVNDEVKFVIIDRIDYDFAKAIVNKYSLSKTNEVLFSPVFGKIDYQQLVNWILEDHLNVRFQLQIHKYIWHPDTRGV
jgi:7-carboxy-7-deazaguanine synthase